MLRSFLLSIKPLVSRRTCIRWYVFPLLLFELVQVRALAEIRRSMKSNDFALPIYCTSVFIFFLGGCNWYVW